jgi:tRNA(Ile)-lysidine synthase
VDLFETVLLRIFRGTGVKGIIGIDERKGYIRPLLDITKQEIYDFCAENDIHYCVDQTNFSNESDRSYIRNVITPLVTERFKNALNGTKRLSENAKKCNEGLNKYAPKATEMNGVFALKVEDLKAQDIFAYTAIANAAAMAGVEKDFERVNSEDVFALLSLQNGARVNLPYGVIAEKAYNEIVFFKPVTAKFEAKPLVINEKYREFKFIKAAEYAPTAFDLEKMLAFSPLIRERQSGDIFHAVNGKRKSLSDYLTDKKIPHYKRDKLLVAANCGEILAVLGIEVSELVKIDSSTRSLGLFC